MSETIPALFFRQAEALGRKPLFFAKRAGGFRPTSWREAAEAVRALSTHLLSLQVNPGDRVLLLSENRPEWGVADLAIQAVGAWTVPIYPSLTVPEIRLICRDCQPSIGIASTSEQAAKLIEVSRQSSSIRQLIVMEPTQHHHALVLGWSDALAKGREQGPKLRDFFERRLRQVRPHDTATIIYTSGTTGEPKGVMLSHQNFLSNVAACLQVFQITGADRHLSFLPLSHVFERMGGWYLMLSVGAAVAYAESMDTIPQDMLAARPTIMLAVPRFFEKLAARIQDGVRQAPAAKRRIAEWALRVGQAIAAKRLADQPVPLRLHVQGQLAHALVFRKLRARLGGRLRFFVSGGAPLAPSIGEFFYRVGVTIAEGYGLTETSPVIAANDPSRPRFGTVGHPVPGVEVRIAEDGEILTRGPHVMQGYYQKPEQTAAVMSEGWFHTGDIGHLDEDGRLAITDRKKDLLKTAGGKFVAPQKLENLLIADPYISQAFVYGDRRPYCVALIVPNTERLRRFALEQEIPGRALPELVRDPRVAAFYWERVQAKQQGLPSFEQVKKIAVLDQEFSQATGELTPTLKAKRSIIAQRYAALLQGLYEPSAG